MATCDTYSPDTSPTKVRKEPTCGTQFMLPSDDPVCVEINGGDFLWSDPDNMAYISYVNAMANYTWDTNLVTTQDNFLSDFIGVALGHYHCDTCYSNHECGVRYAPKESDCGFVAEYTIVDADGDASPGLYVKGDMYAPAKVSGSNLLHASNVIATTDVNKALFKAIEDSGDEAKSTVKVEFV